MEKFFKKVLNKIIELDDRNRKIDKFIKENLKSDFFSMLTSPIAEDYEPLLVEAVSKIFINDEEVKQWIEYLLYENGRNIRIYPKIYKVKDVNSLWGFLVENYELRG